jgi:2-polyprenyl-3-methyl-5-hydroxy-6-metoxy-1,4-benzoquinol methylase
MQNKIICRLCHAENSLESLLDFGLRPITKRLLTSLEDSAEEYLHPVLLNVCNQCSFVQISDFIPETELYSNYELHSAWKPQPHLEDEISFLIQNNIISSNSFIVEVGCNDGIAIHALHKNNIKNILGIEPSKDVATEASKHGYNIINAFFTEKLASELSQKYGNADFVFSRQVLEHVAYLDSFLQGICNILKPDGHLMIEVPDFAVPLKYGDPSAIWEEHVNHFTEETLTLLLKKFGFEIYKIRRYDFSGGALCVFAKRVLASKNFLISVPASSVLEAKKYTKRVEDFKNAILNRLKSEVKVGGKVAIYGAGNRTVILLNYFLKDLVSFVVDDQLEKQNRYLPMSHHQILPSQELISSNVTLCLLAVNAENEEKVIEKNKEYLAKGGKFISILSPSKRLIIESNQ